MQQGNLPLLPKMPTIQDRFEAFHAANPRVYEILRDLAFEARKSGLKKVGVKMLWEVIRWKVRLETRDEGSFKLNNNFPSRYARMLVEQHPEFEEMFERRELRAK